MHARFLPAILIAAILAAGPVCAAVPPDAEAVAVMPEPDAVLPEQEPERPQQVPAAAAVAQEPAYGPATLKITLTSGDQLKKDQESTYILALLGPDGKPVAAEALEDRASAKVDVLIVDSSLTDYHHVQPAAGKEPGTWVVSFTPKTDRGYHIFADVWPKDGAPQFVPAYVEGASPCAGGCCPEKTVADTAKFCGYRATLEFSEGPEAGKPARGEISIIDADAEQMKGLEPMGGAYAHVAGFYEGCTAAVRGRTTGAAPQGEADRGSSPLSFTLNPPQAGFVKLFAHLRTEGREAVLPFGVDVEK
jgi:hypothetical protein